MEMSADFAVGVATDIKVPNGIAFDIEEPELVEQWLAEFSDQFDGLHSDHGAHHNRPGTDRWKHLDVGPVLGRGSPVTRIWLLKTPLMPSR